MRIRSHLRDAYNVFRRKHKPGLCCAVREDMPVPKFLTLDNWSFGYTARNCADLPVGLQRSAALEATNYLGFYLFQDAYA